MIEKLSRAVCHIVGVYVCMLVEKESKELHIMSS